MPAPKPKAKKLPAPRDWRLEAEKFGQKTLQTLFGLTLNWEKQKDIVKNNYGLGVQHFRASQLQDAIFRFKLVTWLAPQYADGWYYLGRSYLAAGKTGKALTALSTAIKLKPGHAETAYLLAIAGGKNTPASKMPTQMPLSLSLEHFDSQAADFAHEQIETYKYQGHTILADALRAQLAGRTDANILELGVGTGLVGPLLRDVASQLTGVDMSPKMLAEAGKLVDAQGRKAYDLLVHKELHAYLETSTDQYDAVLAAGVVSYLGDLAPLFARVAHVLKPGGVFILTADSFDGPGYKFDTEAGRFTFSKEYLQQQASSAGLSAVKLETANIYPDYPAWICVFRK